MIFYDATGLREELSKRINYKFYQSLYYTRDITMADILLCATEELKIVPEKNWRIRFCVCPMTNTDHIKLPDSVKMISLKGEKAFLGTVKSTAEHTLYLMLNLMKKTSRKEDPGHTLFDKHLGIIGSGRVGKQVARMFKHVTMSDLKVNAEVYRADIISIHASVLKGKYPCLGERQLSQVKDGAFIINTSRPCHVDVSAMLKHIDRLGGFASDFTLPSVLAEKKNVIYTEHTGGYTWTDLIRTSSFCFSKLMGELNVEDEKWEAFASED